MNFLNICKTLFLNEKPDTVMDIAFTHVAYLNKDFVIHLNYGESDTLAQK